MCTARESRLFKASVNAIPEKATIKLVTVFPEFNEEFPTKDRETARKHSASKRKAKVRDRSHKVTAYQRSCDLYNSGIDTAGRTFKARRQNLYASIAEKEASYV